MRPATIGMRTCPLPTARTWRLRLRIVNFQFGAPEEKWSCTATHVNSADLTMAISGGCITESFNVPFVLNGLGQNNTTNCNYGPGSPSAQLYVTGSAYRNTE